MYELSDKKSAVKEIQKFLYLISDKVNSDIPRVSIDGFYGAETEKAVSEFQIMYGIKPTGRVDRITFEMMYDLYSENKPNYEIDHMSESLFPVKFGAQGNHVLNIHLLMIELQNRYRDIGTVIKSSYFSKESENATKELQKIFRLPENGAVDRNMYDRFILELDSLKRFENT